MRPGPTQSWPEGHRSTCADVVVEDAELGVGLKTEQDDRLGRYDRDGSTRRLWHLPGDTGKISSPQGKKSRRLRLRPLHVQASGGATATRSRRSSALAGKPPAPNVDRDQRFFGTVFDSVATAYAAHRSAEIVPGTVVVTDWLDGATGRYEPFPNNCVLLNIVMSVDVTRPS